MDSVRTYSSSSPTSRPKNATAIRKPGLRRYAGPAPVTRRSGKGLVVMMRRGCNARLRNALYHMARVSVTCDPAARAYYASVRARGHRHGRALRSVADRWIRILMAMLRDRTLYNAGHSRQAAVEAA